ncbi:MAG: HEPN domain-containing protein [Planctomycetota bacterium]|jgi:HEPN domain-containing protein
MVDIHKQISYWRSGAEEDVIVAAELIGNKRYRHGLFFAHLALEKILKAHICKKKNELAPRIHNLVRLSEVAAIELDEDILDHLADMNEFNLEGRYPIQYIDTASNPEANSYLNKTKEVIQWLVEQL